MHNVRNLPKSCSRHKLLGDRGSEFTGLLAPEKLLMCSHSSTYRWLFVYTTVVPPAEVSRIIQHFTSCIPYLLGDPDVVALVANDLASLHRKGWRVSDMLEQLERSNITLVLAAPERVIDTSTPLGKIFIQFTAMFDEYYAEDLSQRAKDSVAFRKAKGKTIGLPPLGTVRDTNGFLIPSPEGAWFLPDEGRYVAGDADNAPAENAIWRGYYEAAERILTIYVEGDTGLHKIAYLMSSDTGPSGIARANPALSLKTMCAVWSPVGVFTADSPLTAAAKTTKPTKP